MKPPVQSPPAPPTHDDVLEGFKPEVALPQKRRRPKRRHDPLSFFETEQPPAATSVADALIAHRVLELAGPGEPLAAEVELAPLVTTSFVPAARHRGFRDVRDRFAPHAALGLAAVTTLVIVVLSLQDAGTDPAVVPPSDTVTAAVREPDGLETTSLEELVALATPVAAAPTRVARVAVDEEKPSREQTVARRPDSRTGRSEVPAPRAPVPIAAVSRLAPLPSASPPATAAPSPVTTGDASRVATPPAAPSALPARPAPPRETAPAVPVEAVDTRAIQQVLGQYRNAFSALDSAAAKAVWPSVDARALSRAFDRLREQSVDFSQCNIAISGDRATASCAGSSTYVPKVGSRVSHIEARQWWFNLRKVDDTWLIDQVDTR